MTSINSVSSGSPVQAPPKAAPVEATQARQNGKDLNSAGNADGATAKSSASEPFTNTMGQKTGGTLNVTA